VPTFNCSIQWSNFMIVNYLNGTADIHCLISNAIPYYLTCFFEEGNFIISIASLVSLLVTLN
jgi:hypothetical protein